MKTLVLGGTGTVGTQVVKFLLATGQSVRIMTTSLEKMAGLSPQVECVVGDLNQPETLDDAFRGVDRVFLLNGQSQQEAQQGLNAVEAAKRAGVRKLVYQSIHNVRKGGHIPHFRLKIQIEEAVAGSGLAYVFISPNNFFQNDFWFREAIVNYQIYNQPIGDIGLNRIDVRDIAQATVRALLSDEFDGQTIPLVGAEILNGTEVAQILTEQLGYDVQYAGNDLETWAEQARNWLPAWIVKDWVMMFHFFQEYGLIASAADLALTQQILGRSPRTYVDFIRENVSFFSKEPLMI